ncbi:PorP/SprF family type IX secretion system membrane protein [Sediminicola sp. 1XM1-17]|uniref:PorP/SprF family type IX secretion system membrane protein n=1 Tax=Sediminicola sp. 1XM1-17 TaxID=3127702 RepID=UPI0030789024
MGKFHLILLFFVVVFGTHAQDVALPGDLRQHNLTMFNASLLDPTFALDKNNPQSIALWTRWQWQTVDADPSTTLLNYTTNLNENSVIGGGFIQHNTGIYLQTGGILNYVYAFDLGEHSKLAFGLNVLGYQREIADDRPGNVFFNDGSNDFIMQIAPGIRFMQNGFSLSVTSENFVAYSFNAKVNESRGNNNKVIMGAIGYDIPITLFGTTENTYLQPRIYLKDIPQMDSQLGLTTSLTSPNFWVQGGYNNFYGASAGLGGNFFKTLSVGVLMEFGLDQNVKDKDPTFELITAFRFGNKKEQEIVTQEVTITPGLNEEEGKVTEQLKSVPKTEESKSETQKKDTLPQAEKDIIKTVTANEKESTKIPQSKENNVVTKGKYEEVEKQEGLIPGYYLIANVFGTKKYFENFMSSLRKKGLEPQSFYRSLNNFNYVYLDRYNSLEAAEKARDSKFYGRYSDTTWIFRVIGE